MTQGLRRLKTGGKDDIKTKECDIIAVFNEEAVRFSIRKNTGRKTTSIQFRP